MSIALHNQQIMQLDFSKSDTPKSLNRLQQTKNKLQALPRVEGGFVKGVNSKRQGERDVAFPKCQVDLIQYKRFCKLSLAEDHEPKNGQFQRNTTNI